MAKRASDSTLVTTAERVGRTLGRIAKGLDKVKAIRKKVKPNTRPRKAPKQAPKVDPVAAATQAKAKLRDSWKAQEHDASAAVKSQHGMMVDERALARAKDGQRWAARKPR